MYLGYDEFQAYVRGMAESGDMPAAIVQMVAIAPHYLAVIEQSDLGNDARFDVCQAAFGRVKAAQADPAADLYDDDLASDVKAVLNLIEFLYSRMPADVREDAGMILPPSDPAAFNADELAAQQHQARIQSGRGATGGTRAKRRM